MGVFSGMMSRVSKSGRNLRKKEYAQSKRTARHQIYSIQEAINQRKIEDPREQAQLKQGMFGRGIGKSTIMDQEKGRLDLMQKNRNAALARSLQIAHKNLSLIKKRWRYGKRIQWAQSVDDLLTLAGGVAAVYGSTTGGSGVAGTNSALGATGGP